MKRMGRKEEEKEEKMREEDGRLDGKVQGERYQGKEKRMVGKKGILGILRDIEDGKEKDEEGGEGKGRDESG